MRLLTVNEVINMCERLVGRDTAHNMVRDAGALASSVEQPLASFGGFEFYPGLIDKAAALGFFLIRNHPFVDGNKRVGHAAMETCLLHV